MHDFRTTTRIRIAVTSAFVLSSLAVGLTAAQRGSGDEQTAAGGAGDDRFVDFSTILNRHQRQTVQAVGEYIDEHAGAGDLESAYRWMFQTALDHGLEADCLEAAETYLKREGGRTETQRLAQRVFTLGLAKTGELEAALVAFSDSLRAARPASVNEAGGMAHALAAEAQLAGAPEAARDVYKRLSRSFFLNPEVRALSDAKLAKLDLIGTAAPDLGHPDLDNNPVKLADYRGKVVLIDFWATNCPPCIEEFPRLKQIYSRFQNQGLIVIGVSLDDSPENVRRFQRSWELPWRLMMSESGTQSIRQRYRVQEIPSVFLIDRAGRIAYVDLPTRDLPAAIQNLLDAENQPSTESDEK